MRKSLSSPFSTQNPLRHHTVSSPALNLGEEKFTTRVKCHCPHSKRGLTFKHFGNKRSPPHTFDPRVPLAPQRFFAEEIVLQSAAK